MYTGVPSGRVGSRVWSLIRKSKKALLSRLHFCEELKGAGSALYSYLGNRFLEQSSNIGGAARQPLRLELS